MSDRKDYFKKVAAEYYYTCIPSNVLDWIDGKAETPMESDVESLYDLLISAYNKGRIGQYHQD